MTVREETSAGGVVVRTRAGRIEVLLGEQRDRITGARTTRLPKGHVDAGETLEQTALREVAEETGRRAVVREPLDDVSYRYVEPSRGETVAKRVSFFLMDDAGAAPDGPDGELQHVFWSPIDEAPGLLTFEPEREVVRRAARRLGIGPDGGTPGPG